MHYYYQNNITEATIIEDFRAVSTDSSIPTPFLDKIKALCGVFGTAEDTIITSNLQTLIKMFTDITSYVIFPTVFVGHPNSYAVCCDIRNKIRNFILYHKNITALTNITYLPKAWDGIAPQTILPSTEYYYSEETVYNAMILIKNSVTYPEVLTSHPKPITINYTAGFTDIIDIPHDILSVLVRSINALRVNTGDGCADCNSVLTDPINRQTLTEYRAYAQHYNVEAFRVCNDKSILIK